MFEFLFIGAVLVVVLMISWSERYSGRRRNNSSMDFDLGGNYAPADRNSNDHASRDSWGWGDSGDGGGGGDGGD